MELTQGRICDLFEVVTFMAERYGIDLYGDEAIWPFSFEGKLDYRLSDFEHTLHELGHGIVAGLLGAGEADFMQIWEMLQLEPEEELLNEIRVYSIVRRVLELNGVHDDGSMYDCIDVILGDHRHKNVDLDVDQVLDTYADSWAGQRNIGSLVKAFNHNIALLNAKQKRKHKIERLRRHDGTPHGCRDRQGPARGGTRERAQARRGKAAPEAPHCQGAGRERERLSR